MLARPDVFPGARAAASLSLLLLLVSCAETGELLPSCTEGRSRCVAQVSVGARYWAESPEGGPEDFGFRAQLTFLFPK